MVGWHHQFDGHEFEYALGVGDEQGSLVGCRLWCCTESDTTEAMQQQQQQQQDTDNSLLCSCTYNTCLSLEVTI